MLDTANLRWGVLSQLGLELAYVFTEPEIASSLGRGQITQYSKTHLSSEHEQCVCERIVTEDEDLPQSSFLAGVYEPTPATLEGF